MTSSTTRVHHLNCATMAPPLAGRTGLGPARMVAHCLLLERADGLVLVDTGLGTADLADPRGRLGRPFLAATGAALDPAETAVAQVRGLGLDPEDVRDVVVTHLDLDHAGGIGDFPQARVHVWAGELDAATARATLPERNRYVTAQWAHGPRWVRHELDGEGEEWCGLRGARVLDRDGELLLVPLPGHTRGHAGVAVRRPGGGWFLHAGDAYFSAAEKEDPPRCPPFLKLFQGLVQVDRRARHASADVVRSVHARHGDEVTVFCAHDAVELEALAGTTD